MNGETENGRTETADVRKGNFEGKILDATNLKLLAAVLMLLDHIHQMFSAVGAPLWLTMAGRPVFPLFLFAASESFYHTRSKRKYLQRLLAASWGMTIFTFLLQRLIPNDNVVLMNNAFSTFFVTGLYMLFWNGFMDGLRRRDVKKIIKSVLGGLIPVACALPIYLVAVLSFQENVSPFTIRFLATLALLVPNILTVEGGFSLVVLGTAFYVFRNHRVLQIAVLLILSGFSYFVDGGIQWMMCFAAIPIFLYNGKPGRGKKWFFYIFYPAHIALLYLISAWCC